MDKTAVVTDKVAISLDKVAASKAMGCRGDHVEHIRTKQIREYKCADCGAKFWGKHQMEAHMLVHTGGGLKCKVCGLLVTSFDGLRKHLRTHSGEKPYACDICGRGFSQTCSLINHKRVHTKERPFVCGECGARYTQVGNLRRHMLSHTGEKLYECPDCHNRFTENATLKRHLLVHTGEKPYTCESCGCSFRNRVAMVAHIRTLHKPDSIINVGSDGTSFVCKICDKKFDSPSGLNPHIASHAGKAFQCKKCGKKFAQERWYLRHVAAHDQRRSPLECDICQRTFASRHKLIRHQVVHTGERPYLCNECGARFGTKTNLQIHIRIHTGEKPYACHICGDAFSAKGNMTRHVSFHFQAATKVQSSVKVEANIADEANITLLPTSVEKEGRQGEPNTEPTLGGNRHNVPSVDDNVSHTLTSNAASSSTTGKRLFNLKSVVWNSMTSRHTYWKPVSSHTDHRKRKNLRRRFTSAASFKTVGYKYRQRRIDRRGQLCPLSTGDDNTERTAHHHSALLCNTENANAHPDSSLVPGSMLESVRKDVTNDASSPLTNQVSNDTAVRLDCGPVSIPLTDKCVKDLQVRGVDCFTSLPQPVLNTTFFSEDEISGSHVETSNTIAKNLPQIPNHNAEGFDSGFTGGSDIIQSACDSLKAMERTLQDSTPNSQKSYTEDLISDRYPSYGARSLTNLENLYVASQTQWSAETVRGKGVNGPVIPASFLSNHNSQLHVAPTFAADGHRKRGRPRKSVKFSVNAALNLGCTQTGAESLPLTAPVSTSSDVTVNPETIYKESNSNSNCYVSKQVKCPAQQEVFPSSNNNDSCNLTSVSSPESVHYSRALHCDNGNAIGYRDELRIKMEVPDVFEPLISSNYCDVDNGVTTSSLVGSLTPVSLTCNGTRNCSLSELAVMRENVTASFENRNDNSCYASRVLNLPENIQGVAADLLGQCVRDLTVANVVSAGIASLLNENNGGLIGVNCGNENSVKLLLKRGIDVVVNRCLGRREFDEVIGGVSELRQEICIGSIKCASQPVTGTRR